MRTIFIFIFCFIYGVHCFAQGSEAGLHKKWLNQEVEKNKEALFFKGYTFHTYNLLQDDPELEYSLLIYQKSSTAVVMLISQIKDALSYTIKDVVEIKNLKKFDNIQSATCQLNGEFNSKIFVLEKKISKKPVNTKAWYTDTDKMKFITIPVKGINCLIDD